MRSSPVRQAQPNSRPLSGQFAAVTVTHNPPVQDGRLAQQVTTMAQAAKLHVIVDNASSNIDAIERVLRTCNTAGSFHIIRSDRNLGIAAALNEGIHACLDRSSADWVLMLDQDTCFPPDSFDQLAKELETMSEDERPGIIGFNYLRRRLSLTSLSNQSGGITTKHSVMTSGSFGSREVLQKLSFDETLFMYFVDVDFCHRVEESGYSILQLFSAMTDSQEGQVIVRWGKKWSFLEPWRLYFVGRNGIRVFRRFGHLSDLLYTFLTASTSLLAGRSVSRSAVEFSRGVVDGLRWKSDAAQVTPGLARGAL